MATALMMVLLVALFGVGAAMMASGMRMLLSKDVQDAMKKLSINSVVILSSHSAVSGKGANDISLPPIMDSASRLIESISNLIRTNSGVGAFLCLLGLTTCLVSVWMLSWLR